MPLTLHEDAYGDPRNVCFLAVASDIAYLPKAEAEAAFREQLGLTAATFVSAGNSQAYIVTNDEHIVVAFRGTEAPTSIEGLKDWLLTDAMNLLILPEGRLGTDFAAAGVGAKFHQGFINAIADVWDPVYQAIDAEIKTSERPLWITGHSLGGALAVLSAWLCTRKFISVHQIYTFGAPMVGNAAASAAIGRALPNKIFRYVNGPDPIPKLPSMSLIANEYGHCECEKAVGEPATGFFDGFIGKAVNGLLNASLVDEMWNHIKGRVDAHGMASYLTLVRGTEAE
jgi:hypothetical protein